MLRTREFLRRRVPVRPFALLRTPSSRKKCLFEDKIIGPAVALSLWLSSISSEISFSRFYLLVHRRIVVPGAHGSVPSSCAGPLRDG